VFAYLLGIAAKCVEIPQGPKEEILGLTVLVSPSFLSRVKVINLVCTALALPERLVICCQNIGLEEAVTGRLVYRLVKVKCTQ